MDRKLGGHTHNSTILLMPILQEILTNQREAHQKSTNNANSTAQQKAHNDVNDIPPHQPHNPLSAWR